MKHSPSNDSVYVLKCLSCVSLNAETAAPSLPVICPILHMPCFALKPDMIDTCLDKHLLEKEDPREPMDSECMDQEILCRMIDQYRNLPKSYQSNIKY